MPQVRHWLRIPATMFAAAILIGLVAAHTSLVQPDEFHLERVLQTDLRTGWLTTVMLDVSDVVSPVGGLLVLAAGTAWLLFVRRRPVDAVATFLVVAVGWNAAQLGKFIVARHRPPVMYSLAPETGSDSFPSGHVCFTVSAALALYFLARGTRHQRAVTWLGCAAVVLVAFSRLYIGAHYPTDVAGSVLISFAAVVLLTGVWHRWLLPRLDRVPLLARFGPLPGTGGTARPAGDEAKPFTAPRSAHRLSD
ncbi:phosphatase PAP2 family protein [Streptomyces sp. NBC_01476]|uniref:phosphatase PAP2 family protein n=1 Tax=Streptomyces sp. NBC_01476 TaxID=2903881 RepID=UPI002E338AEA|nr:phosphatase PAP2 family protein [Streptomyces sp. NBC_01476]